MNAMRTTKAITIVILLIVLGMLFGCTSTQKEADLVDVVDVSPATSLALLQEGNARFVQDMAGAKDISEERREILSHGQSPFAIIISCSDSRTPPEVVFDQGLGELFVVRLAGNVVDDVAVGSIEYAAAVLETPLIVVMGHESCGAVSAAVKGGEVPGSIGAIVQIIEPAIASAKAAGVVGDELYEAATDENVRNTMETIKESPVIADLIKGGSLEIVGAKHLLESGVVDFFSLR